LVAIGLAAASLADCAYENPNVYTYGWQPPPGPSPYARSFLGYDPAYGFCQRSRQAIAGPQM